MLGRITRKTTRMLILCSLCSGTLLAAACMFYMPGASHRGPLADLSPAEKIIARNLRGHVQKLAGEIGERNVYNYAALTAASEYIEERFRAHGYRVRRQEYRADGKTVWNVIAAPNTTDDADLFTAQGKILLIGAHYDSVAGSPGADDNASGVAAMLEIARLLSADAALKEVQGNGAEKIRLRFAAFVNEEPPFFQTETMGSLVLARALRKKTVRLRGMLSLETMGYYSDAKNSQAYPFPFSLFFPSKGNFIGFVGDARSGSLVRDAIGGFRKRTRFPSEGLAVSDSIPGIGWSDHWSFSQVGYKGVMITDTAPFRNPHYHLQSDLPHVIDYERMARVTLGLADVTSHLLSH